ncbi:MAG: MoxR family ATPase [Butyrivibrio sp.]|nr:MoxR family ATPase [Butyrivibrio sp.]
MAKTDLLRANINKFFVGKEDVVDNILICLLAGGHVLIEDVPGLGKTTLASVLAKSIQCSFGRIQCTPDTLPGDITGVSIFNQKTSEFEYNEGAIMNQLVLVDEINRTTPKTQSSLLEAMAENQVTIDGGVHRLPSPFLVIATENPVEYVGTYPLPEAQLDRFMMCLKIGYPDKNNEIRIAKQMLEHRQADNVTAVCTTNDIEAMKADVERITVSDAVISYIVDIIRATREEERFVLGASPRAMLALTKAARAKAYLEERDFVKPDDVKAVARQVLLHRFTLTSKARGQREDVLSIFNNILTKVKVPV